MTEYYLMPWLDQPRII